MTLLVVISTFPQIEAKLGSLGRKIIYSWILSFLKNDFASNDSPFRKSVGSKFQKLGSTSNRRFPSLPTPRNTPCNQPEPPRATSSGHSTRQPHSYPPAFSQCFSVPCTVHSGTWPICRKNAILGEVKSLNLKLCHPKLSPDFRKQNKMVSLPKTILDHKIHFPKFFL